MNMLIENVVSSQEKYNTICLTCGTAESKYNKLLNKYEACQK